MPVWYLDTSAALKLVAAERESAALAEAIQASDARLVATRLLETEMRRAAHRALALHQDQITAFLSTLDLYSVTDAVYRQAGLMPGPRLRSLDALHLAAAIALDVHAILTYDHRLQQAAAEVGVVALAPGAVG
ncbi:PIN domain-containing protein [Nocardioides sp. Bht2]|uniref:PIN domain-containing protein n=1 Tax=Nocardioides sp. Bht2 TaxID=3392297 RepID=UPI0039B43264